MSSALTTWNPFGSLDPFRKEMDTLLERFFGNSPRGAAGGRGWSPQMDVEETAQEFIVKADIPGVDPKAVEVTVENGVLTIRGEKKEEREQKDKNYHRVERFSGSFYRSVALPPGVDAEKVTATSAHGVITVTVPKKAETQPKKITVTPK